MSDAFKLLITLLIVGGIVAGGMYLFRSVKRDVQQEYNAVKQEIREGMVQKAKAEAVEDIASKAIDKLTGAIPVK